MTDTGPTPLSLRTEGETDVIITRRFRAPPEAVFRAHTEAALMQKWMLGPPGWTMPVCQSDSRPGGAIRLEWVDGTGGGFHLTGEYHEVTPHSRLVHVERMHLPPPGPDPTPDNRIETAFAPWEGGTRLTLRMRFADAAARDAMLATGMAGGMEQSYARLDEMDL